MYKTLLEAFEQRKFSPGQTSFSKSSFSDPHIRKAIAAIANAINVSPQQIEASIQAEVDKFGEMKNVAPILYGTIMDNIIEDRVFTLLQDHPVKTSAPQFSKVTFMKLVRAIASEHDEFWPLRSFIDKRRLNPSYDFPEDPNHQIKTAAASPSGVFYFNVNFCQKLLDYADVIGLKPAGMKYMANGGDIPDGYAYIEFLIMHEFMHYSNDDFYYGRIIPDANPKIINWVGDFRSNYLLVKSGYQQLPMGLFNDNINYDRQKTYIEMYRLVESEFNKLNEKQKEEVSKRMDQMSDDHEPGQEEADKQKGKPDDPMNDKNVKPGDIDKKGKETEEQMKSGKDQKPDERKEPKKGDEPGKGDQEGGQGKGGKNPASGEVDYNKIRPAFSWTAIMKRFLGSVSKKTYETYSRPARRGVASVDIMRQTGSAAIKPAEKPLDNTDAKLMFCFDSSGSMGHVIAKVYANAVQLLRQPQFKNSDVIVFRYSASHDIFRVNFARNKAAQVPDIKAKARQYPKTAQQIFSEHVGSSTNFSAEMASQLIAGLADKWNVLIFIDGDNLVGQNFVHLSSVIKAKPAQVFVIFDSRNTYINFRQKFGGATPNITYFE